MPENITWQTPLKYKSTAVRLKNILYLSISSFLVALFLFLFWKKPTKKLSDIIIKKNRQLILPGLILLVTGPIIFIILLMTIVAIPLALMFLIFWGLAIYLGKILAALALSSYISGRWETNKLPALLQLFLVILIISILLNLPFLGGLLSFLFSVLGLGLTYSLIKNKNVKN